MNHLGALQNILLRDPELLKRAHSTKKTAAHLKRRGFQTALGNNRPEPPLTWAALPAPPSPVHGFAWIGLDGDTLIKALALGFLPPKIKRPTVAQAWEYAQGRCRAAMLHGERYRYYQEATTTERHLRLHDPIQGTLLIPLRQLCQTTDHPELSITCRKATIALLDAAGRPIPNPNHSRP